MGTREEWLQQAVGIIRPYAEQQAGVTVPEVAVSVGFPYGGRGGRGGLSTIGQCHYATADGAPAIFIHPVLDDGARVLDVLLHEAIHAALPVGTGHKRPFAKAAEACGLAGKPTATVASEALAPVLAGWLEVLGPYPHARVDTSAHKKQTTRMLKVVCPDCGYTVRTTAKWLEVGLPTCPCGEEMVEG